MKFYDNELKSDVETKEENGEAVIYIKGRKYPLPISPDILKQYPDWVATDAVRLMARRISRKEHVDRLAAAIIKEE